MDPIPFRKEIRTVFWKYFSENKYIVILNWKIRYVVHIVLSIQVFYDYQYWKN